MTTPTCTPATIEEELSRIWESHEGSHKTWASLFNIVFYIKSAPAKEQHRWLLDLVSKKFPCRSIFINEDSDPSQEYLRVRVAAETIGEGEMSVVCDQIFIEVAGSERKKVPYLILPHFLTDLPIYVIWTHDPTEEDPILSILRKYATKMIYDPGFCGNLQHFSGALLKQIEGRRGCSVTDLCWVTSSGWREVLAATFQTSQRVDELFHAKYIRIGYNKGNPSCTSDENQALYIQAWIAAQLNWKVKDMERIEGNVRISYSRFMYETVALLTPEVHEGLPRGAITSIEIDSQQGTHFLFQRSSEAKRVKVWISSAESCDIPYQIYFTQATLELVLLGEFFSKGTNPHYRNLLSLLYELQWQE